MTFLLPSPRRQFLYFLMCGFCLLLSAGAGAIMVLAATATHWPTVQATVLASGVGSHANRKSTTTYSPDISYSYKVKGENYASSIVQLGGMSFHYEPDAREYADARPVGSTVTARYFPPWPALAVLESGTAPGLTIMLLVGALMYAGSLLLSTLQRGR